MTFAFSRNPSKHVKHFRPSSLPASTTYPLGSLHTTPSTTISVLRDAIQLAFFSMKVTPGDITLSQSRITKSDRYVIHRRH